VNVVIPEDLIPEMNLRPRRRDRRGDGPGRHLRCAAHRISEALSRPGFRGTSTGPDVVLADSDAPAEAMLRRWPDHESTQRSCWIEVSGSCSSRAGQSRPRPEACASAQGAAQACRAGRGRTSIEFLDKRIVRRGSKDTLLWTSGSGLRTPGRHRSTEAREGESNAGGDHRRSAGVDGLDDVVGVDAL
jgi:hypothetical protein